MRTNITKQEVEALRKDFLEYADRAEVHIFPLLALIQGRLDYSVEHFEEMTIGDINAMFRVVYGLIGKDATEYAE